MLKNPSESAIQKAIVRVLLIKKFLVIRFNSGASITEQEGKRRFTRFYQIINNNISAGLSDLIAFKDNNYYFIEVKTKSGKLGDSQLKFKALLEYMNIDSHYIVFRSWEECIKWAEGL